MVREDIKLEREKGEKGGYNCLSHYRSTLRCQTSVLLATMNQMTPCPPPPLPGSVDLVVASHNWQPESRLSLISVIFGI